MIKRETVTSLLVGFLAGACGIFPVVAGDGFGFGPAQGGGGVTDAELLAIGALTPTDGNVIVGDGSTWVAESGATARTSLGALGGYLGSTDNAILTADGTGGATAQGTTATYDAGVLTLPAGGNARSPSFSGSIAAISTVTLLDPADGAVQTITLSASMSGNATFSVDTTNLSASYARAWTVVVTDNGSGPYTLVFDADWNWLSPIPTTTVDGAKSVLYLVAYGAAETDVFACWVDLQ